MSRLLLLAFLAWDRGAQASQSGNLTIGVCNDIEWFDYYGPAYVLALDDARRNGSNVLPRPMPNLRNVEINYIHFETACDTSLGNDASILFFEHRVNAILGCSCSSVSEVVARMGTLMKIPQISWISAAWYLTKNSEQTKYFMRTIVPLGDAPRRLQVVLSHFNWTEAKYVHLSDQYSNLLDEDMFYESARVCLESGISVLGVPLEMEAILGGPPPVNGSCPEPWVLAPTGQSCEDLTSWRRQVREMRRKRGLVHVFVSSHNRGLAGMELIHEEGLLRHVWLLESAGAWNIGMSDSLWEALVGSFEFGGDPFYVAPPLAQRIGEMWDTQNLDLFRSRLPANMVGWMEDFDEWPPIWWVENYPAFADAIFTVFLAFEELLAEGHPISELRGDRLHQKMLNMSFAGADGPMAFDAKGDKSTPDPGGLDNLHMVNGTTVWVTIAAFRPSGIVLLPDETIVWPNNASTPPTGLPPDCEEGFHFDGLECVGCGAGREFAGQVFGGGECEPCAKGKAGTNICRDCDEGRFANETGQSECRWCPPGYQCGMEGLVNPIPCPKGSYNDGTGNTSCSMCISGTYTDVEAQTECFRCAPETTKSPQLWKTMQRLLGVKNWVPFAGAATADACGCQAGAYLKDGDCVPCTVGMECLGMGDMELLPGYASFPGSPSDIWRCYGEAERCPGGPSGTCAKNRDAGSITCSECMEGFRRAENGECEACTGQDYLPVVGASALALVALCAVYRAVDTENRAKQAKSMVMVALANSQLITIYQQMGILSMISVDWPYPFSRLLDVLSLLNFDIDILHVDCVARTGALGKFATRVFLVFGLFAMVLAIHCVMVLAFHGGRFRERNASLLGSMGTIFMSFMVSIVTSLISPLQCQVHPNGEQTVRTYQTVVCWSSSFGGEHGSMVLLSLVACLVPLGFVVAAARVVWKLPQKMREGNAEFLHTFAFLFFRFRLGCHWFVLVFICRNFLVALIPVIPEPSGQIILMVMLLLPSLVLTTHVLPWRVYEANVLDIFSSMGVLTILGFAAFFVDAIRPEALGVLSCCLFGVIMALVAGIVAIGLHDRFLRRGNPFEFFICHHKAGAGNMARLLKMYLLEHPNVRRKVFVDSDDLSDLSTLFGTVQGRLDTLVVLCSKEVLTRPWCVGEVTTSHLNKVEVVKVILPDFSFPTEKMIANYQDHVPGILALAEHGMSVQAVQDALRWLKTRPEIVFPQQVSMPAMAELTVRLVGRDFKEDAPIEPSAKSVKSLRSVAATPTSQGKGYQEFIVADMSNNEAVCTACVIKKMLTPLMPMGQAERMPQILDADDTLPASARQVVLVCTNGLFQKHFVKDAVAAAWRVKAAVIPVVSESSFRFPTQAFYDELRAQEVAPAIRGTGGAPDVSIVSIVEAIFTEIAVEVNPQDAEAIIQVRVVEVARRLMSGELKALSDMKMAAGQDQDKDKVEQGAVGNGDHGSPEAIALTMSVEDMPELVDFKNENV